MSKFFDAVEDAHERNNRTTANDTEERVRALDTRLYACDFETTTEAYSDEETKVWSFQACEIGTENVEIYGSIQEFIKWCSDTNKGYTKKLFFHNLKFDGEFIMHYLLSNGYETVFKDGKMGSARDVQEYAGKGLSYLIDKMGMWYSMSFTVGRCMIDIRDSLKILPMTLEKVGKDFCKKHHKTKMEYDGKQSLKDCSVSDLEYLREDVLVLSEALAGLFGISPIEGNPFPVVNHMTIGGEALSLAKSGLYGEWGKLFPNLKDIKIDEQEYGSPTAYDYIKNSYHGGVVLVNPKYKGKIVGPGYTMDVNSEHPYSMHSTCGQPLPVGRPAFKKGKPIDNELEWKSRYIYVRVRCHLDLKKGYMPTIQPKGNRFYSSTEYLTTSDIKDPLDGKYYYHEIELTLAEQDYKLMLKHYDVYNLQYLDYCVFCTASGVFDPYIDNLMRIKRESKGAIRALAKLLLNSLYGQLCKTDDSSYKVARLDPETKQVVYTIVEEHDKKTVHIGCGAAITAQSRYYLMTAIDSNMKHFVYCDTDSLHCVGKPEEFVGHTDEKELGAFKCEHTWEKGRFIRAKSYYEILNDCDEMDILEEYAKYDEKHPNRYTYEQYKQLQISNICCAGMTDEQKEVVATTKGIEGFDYGLEVRGGKLQAKRVKGGIILRDVDFSIK